MDDVNAKTVLQRYLQTGRDALLWKLEGLSEYDVRRPMVTSGTNLLGIVKHTASVEAGYFGEVFDRPFAEPLPWIAADAEDNADMWATLEESPESIIGLYHRVWANSDATIAALPLDAPGVVPWWPGERGKVTLQQILVHMIAETHRHAGHADIVRELIDGSAGLRADNSNLPEGDRAWWESYRRRLETVALSTREGVDDPTVTDPANYRALWENEFVRVLEYDDVPGAETSPHDHPNSVMVTLSGFDRRLSSGGRESDVSLPRGKAVWLPAQRHSGTNTGETPTHTILVELKGAAAGTALGASLGPQDL
ncbi:DUF664 domain-containing protein [Subtercola sp. PAMC28395]|uniref:mycothiol transferase n=1 Tax=Subtercola sp. PAMC28395 TaxID=2846775 RepID=UPI00352BFCB6